MTDYSTEIDELSDEELEAKLKALAEAAEKRKAARRPEKVREVRNAIVTYEIGFSEVYPDFYNELVKLDREKQGQFTRDDILKLFAVVSLNATNPEPETETPKKAKAAKEGTKQNRPKVIYLNEQAVDGEKLYAGGPKPPSWFDKDNEAIKSKFAVKDYAEQIKILRKFGDEKKAKDREEWLAENPTETSSK